MTLQDPKDTPQDAKGGWARGVGLLSVVTSEFLVSTGLGVGVGYLLWKKAGFPVWTMAILSFLGLCFAFYRLYLISQKDW